MQLLTPQKNNEYDDDVKVAIFALLGCAPGRFSGHVPIECSPMHRSA